MFPFIYQAELSLSFRHAFDQNPDPDDKFKGEVGQEIDKWEMHIEESS